MPTHSELMAMSKADLEAMLVIGYTPKPSATERAKIQEHVAYRTALNVYGSDVNNKAIAGPGSNPPGPPPPPPGV